MMASKQHDNDCLIVALRRKMALIVAHKFGLKPIFFIVLIDTNMVVIVQTNLLAILNFQAARI